MPGMENLPTTVPTTIVMPTTDLPIIPPPAQQPDAVLSTNQERGEPTDTQNISAKQRLQLEVQHREMQEMRKLYEQQKTELADLREQFARILHMNPAPSLIQPPHNSNHTKGPVGEFQAVSALNQ